jgi:cytochrome c biogenesis protein CcmG, thiol:disulfide interchange protein DsbE
VSVRAGTWVIAAAVVGAIGFALWTSQSVPDPVGRGSIAPAFALAERPGPGETSLASLRGQVVLLNFWATWCEPCEREMPAMERLHRALGPEGLHLVAVSVDESSEPVDQFRERFGLTFKILLDPDKRVANLYQTYRFPETLLIGRDGVVIERYVGPRDWDSPLYEQRIRRLLQGKEAP